MAELRLANVTKKYGEITAVSGLTCDVAAGQLAVVVGPSGCGKTTTLRLIAGLETPDAGTIHLNGRDLAPLAPHERGLAMVFQSPALYPHKTVEKNLHFALRRRRVDAREAASRVAHVAKRLGIQDLMHRRPHELSGGEEQRVALGKAIISEARLWLLDEPLASLDAPLRRQLRQDIVQLQRQTGTTTLLVTHDQEEALSMGDWLIVMRGGRVQQVGPPADVYARPVNRFVATFLGDPPMNLIRGHINAGVFHSAGISLPAPAKLPDGPVEFGIRPEAVRIREMTASETVSAVVQRVEGREFRGHAVIARIRAGEHVLNVRGRPGPTPSVGDGVGLILPSDACHFFSVAEEGERLA